MNHIEIMEHKITKKSYFLLTLILALILSTVAPIVAFAASGVPTIFSYQGRLANSSGNLLGASSGTTYYFKFSIWNNATIETGTKLWPSSDPTSFATTVRSGVFNVNIGDTVNGYPDTLNYNFNTNKTIYLQVEVSSNGTSFETLSPRQQISSAIFAQLSGAVSGTGQSSFGTTTPIGTAVVTIQATSTRAIPALIRASLGQVASLFRIEDSLSNNLFSINALGGILASSTLQIASTTGSTSLIVNSSGNVGVGTGAPARKFNVFGANSVPQFRLSQGSSVYSEFYIDSAGDVQLSSTGGNIRLQNENLWVCSGGSCAVSTPADEGNIIIETSLIFDNSFKFKQDSASTTMYDTLDNPILQFDEGQ